ncbi:hypothetical protein PMI06_008872 [Burkholderia sp. BT03]|nr:hypothetical protein PMI06_008872 [Burkholderia sp. BT03]
MLRGQPLTTPDSRDKLRNHQMAKQCCTRAVFKIICSQHLSELRIENQPSMPAATQGMSCRFADKRRALSALHCLQLEDPTSRYGRAMAHCLMPSIVTTWRGCQCTPVKERPDPKRRRNSQSCMPHDELKIRCSRISYNKRCALQYCILRIAGTRRIEGRRLRTASGQLRDFRIATVANRRLCGSGVHRRLPESRTIAYDFLDEATMQNHCIPTNAMHRPGAVSSAALLRERIGASARAPHLKNENATCLPHAVGELKHIQSTSSNVKQKLLDIHNRVCKRRAMVDVGHKFPPSLEKSLYCAGPGNKDLLHR